MTNKRVYYEVHISGSLSAITDSWEGKFIPLDASNSDYRNYLLLSASNRAIVVANSASIPGGITDSFEMFSSITLPVTSSFV